eukprot:2189780-Prymnesium_polylepis.1
MSLWARRTRPNMTGTSAPSTRSRCRRCSAASAASSAHGCGSSRRGQTRRRSSAACPTTP